MSLNLAWPFSQSLCIADHNQCIPQSVWTAAFGHAQPPCVAGFPYSASGIFHRFESIGMDTKVEPPPDFFGHEDRSSLTFGRSLLSNSCVQSNIL